MVKYLSYVPEFSRWDVLFGLVDNTIKAKFERYGYKLPQIVFWNVNGRVGNLPVTMRDENVALISGASPSIIRAVLTDNINPIKIMDNTIETERYNFIQ